jgi:L-rhamnose mutarotase
MMSNDTKNEVNSAVKIYYNELNTKKELVQKCKDMNIKGYSKFKKDELQELFVIIKDLEKISNKKYNQKYLDLYREVYRDI